MAKEFKRISDEDFATLTRWDKPFDHVVHGRFLQGVGSSAVEWMQEWWRKYTGTVIPPVNKNCAACLFTFLHDVGMAYFKEKELRDKEAKEEKAEAGKTKHAPAPTKEARKKARKVSAKSE